MDFNPEPFNLIGGVDALGGHGFLGWLLVFGVSVGLALVVAVLTALVTNFREGPLLVFNRIGDGVRDALDSSWRRIGALSKLTYREAVRRKALLVFVVFAVLFMFGGWFVVDTNERPEMQAQVSIRFVLQTISWLVLPVMLLLACWGLPQDIQYRSIHTVVTKPARRSEIVIGRFLGFAAVGSLLIAGMGVIGWLWVERNFPSPSRTVLYFADGSDLDVTELPVAEDELQRLRDSLAGRDGQEFHAVTATLAHNLEAEVSAGTIDRQTIADTADLRRAIESCYQTGGERGYAAFAVANEIELAAAVGGQWPQLASRMDSLVRGLREGDQAVLVSRVPVYGQLMFTDEQGNRVQKGINVGDIWEFRSYISGATLASAIWDFDGITPELLGDSLLLESNFEAFRTHKGDIEHALSVQFYLAKDLRTDSAEALNAASDFDQLGRMVQQGDVASAAAELQRLGDGLSSEQLELSASEFERVAEGFDEFSRILAPFAEQPEQLAGAAALLASARRVAGAAGDADAKPLGEALTELGRQFEAQAEGLKAALVDVRVPLPWFSVREFKGKITPVRRKIAYRDEETNQTRSVDLFDDLVHGGRLRVVAKCLEPGQYLGMARPDLFIRTPDRPFAAAYFKALAGVWMMMLLIVMVGVTASCFVKGPVATLLTFTVLLVGTGFHPFLSKLVRGEVEGGGAIESIYRMGEHRAPTVPLTEQNVGTRVMQATDRVINRGLWAVYLVTPDLGQFSMYPYVVNGFDVPFQNALLRSIMTLLGFVVPCLLIGYFTLKLRELEAK